MRKETKNKKIWDVKIYYYLYNEILCNQLIHILIDIFMGKKYVYDNRLSNKSRLQNSMYEPIL